jgi:hypothetical protein
MKKILLFIIGPLIAIGLLVVKIPAFESYIKAWHPYAPLGVYCFLAIATLGNYYLSVISPYNILQDAKEKRWTQIDLIASNYTSLPSPQMAGNNYDLSFNIMVPKRKLFSHVEPDGKGGKKISLLPTAFEVVWSYGTYHVNSSLSFTTKQGSCGKAFSDEDFYGFDLEQMRLTQTDFGLEFNLNADQIRLTERLQMVASCPIVLKENRPDAQTVQILGVLNVECHNDGSGVLISNAIAREALYQCMSKLTKAYSQFYLSS